MAIDYIIDYDCIPKQTLTTEGILERIKAGERAQHIITLFRQNGDNRPPSEMGFEMSRTDAEGNEESQVIVVQHMLDLAAELRPLEQHCDGCPANRTGWPFGCMGQVRYPISGLGEAWLLEQLPLPTEPLIWLLLRQGVRDFNYDGSSVAALREESDAYFAEKRIIQRELGELVINSNQVFEMIFMLGHINPNHAGVLLLFFDCIDRDLEADQIVHIGELSPAERAAMPFRHTVSAEDDPTTAELKQFFYALYLAWTLNVRLLLDV